MSKGPDFSTRLPSDQWVVLDSPQTAEAYLGTFDESASIQRQDFPNDEGLYAIVRFRDNLSQCRIYVSAGEPLQANNT